MNLPSSIPLPPHKPLLLVLDYDGTLAPIVSLPSQAYPQPGALELIHALERSPHELYILTGRKSEEIEHFLGLERSKIIGLHGLEWPGETLPEPNRDALAALEYSLPQAEGLRLEDKGHSLAAHYREVAPELQDSLENVLDALPVPVGLERMAGKKVREFRPTGYGKGKALERLITLLPQHHPIFIGDDVTDEAGFTVVNAHGGSSVKVGPGETAARFRLNSPLEVVVWLERWVGHRQDIERSM